MAQYAWDNGDETYGVLGQNPKGTRPSKKGKTDVVDAQQAEPADDPDTSLWFALFLTTMTAPMKVLPEPTGNSTRTTPARPFHAAFPSIGAFVLAGKLQHFCGGRSAVASLFPSPIVGIRLHREANVCTWILLLTWWTPGSRRWSPAVDRTFASTES
ncbi:hypothetical protein B0H19DRAFT_1072568 [Mycena capillaripes]|nr:hypothetical protein B0H19DRAFT_1072568 [Mycena capillaripes]